MKVIFLGIISLLFLSACQPPEPDPAQAPMPEPHGVPDADLPVDIPEASQVRLVNDFVRVEEYVLPPGAQLPLHRGFPRVSFAMSEFTLRYIDNSEPVEETWRQGDVHWFDEQARALENVGESDAHFVVISRTAAPLPDPGDYQLTVADADPAHEHDPARLIFENEYVRVTRIMLAPRQDLPDHDGIARVKLALTEMEIEYESDRFDERLIAFNRGEARWFDPDRHTVTNVGMSVAEFLVFQFRQ